MPRYVTQFGIVPDAWAELAPEPANRRAALGVRLDRQGAQLIDLYQAFGASYDGTALYDAADDATAARATTALGAFDPGGAPPFTLRLRPGEHQRDALRRAAVSPAPEQRWATPRSAGAGEATGPRPTLAAGGR